MTQRRQAFKAPNGATAKALYGQDAREVLRTLPTGAANCIVTSPPYWGHRAGTGEPQTWADGWVGHLGLEPHPDQYAAHVTEVFHEARRVLRRDGTVWLVIGDTFMSNPISRRLPPTGIQGKRAHEVDGYADALAVGHRPAPSSIGLRFKSLVGVPWRVARALQEDRWWIRSEIIWSCPNKMPSRATDRPLVAHETVFLLTRARTYYFDREAGQESGLGKETGKTVWTVPWSKNRSGHPAAMPPALVEPMVLMGCPPGGTVLDPFAGSGTTGEVALRHGRNWVGIDVNDNYLGMVEERLGAVVGR